MRKGAGGSMGLVALLALVLHTQYPSSSEGPAPGHENGGARAAAKNEKAKDAPKPDEPVEGPWIATQAYFQITGETRQLQPGQDPLLTQLLIAKGEPDPGKLKHLLGSDQSDDKDQTWSIIATVPSPLHTHMALRLDGQLEVIERSLQSAGWEFAGQWLPWMDRFDANEGDINERRHQRLLQLEQEEMPGVLIFSSTAATDTFPAKGHLFVFVVPETATSGISGPPFYAALHMANILSTGAHQIGLLAPTFSGSFSSLTTIVKEWQTVSADKAYHKIHNNVYSGSASNVTYAKAFEKAFENTSKMTFHGGIVNTPDSLAAVCTVLKKYNIDPQDAALLKEDESGYSQSFDYLSGCPLPTYVFPRDISHLRNAYQETMGGAARDPYTGGAPSISFSIKDPNSGEDSVPVFSDVQTPLSQDAVLDAIMQDFQRKKKRLVFIVAANALDTLFLMGAVRRECPDTRVLIENPDVLFVPAASHAPLTGTLLLSTYPMFAQGDEWLDNSKTDTSLRSETSLIFPDSTIQGLFNVTQFLLSDIGAVLKGPSLNLRAYGQFRDEHDKIGQPYPGIWLLALNRFGLQPLDVLPLDLCKSYEPDQSWFRPDPTPRPTVLPDEVPWSHGWAVTVLLISSAIVGACLLLILLNVSKTGWKPLWLILTDGYRLRMQALLGACLSLMALDWILASPAWLPLGHWNLERLVVKLWTFIGFLAPLAAFAVLLTILAKRRTRAPILVRAAQLLWSRKKWRMLISLGIRKISPWGAAYFLLCCGLFVFGSYSWYTSCYGTGKSAFFFRFRAVDLYAGSSPAWPLAFLSLLFFCVAMFQFKRYTIAGAGRPRLYFTSREQKAQEHSAFDRKMRAACDGVNVQILAPASLGFPNRCTRVVFGAIFVLICFIFLRFHLMAFELPAYNWALLVGAALALYCLATGCYDLVFISQRLDQLLRLVELLPLQSSIVRVAKEWPRRPIWAFRQSVSRHALTRQMLYALHRRVVILQTMTQERKATALEVHLKAFSAAALGKPRDTSRQVSPSRNLADEPTATTLPEAQKDLERFSEIALGKPGAALHQDSLKEREKYQEVSADVAARIHEKDLRPAWRKSLNEDERPPKDSSAESNEQRYQRYCSDFFALQVCRFITYAVEQVCRVAFSVSATFLMLILFFNSYNPQAPRLVGQFIVGLFLALAFVMFRVFARMERNPTLSRIAHTKPGELNREFWLQLIALGGLPLLGVLAHLFPPVSQFLFQWVAPSVEAAH